MNLLCLSHSPLMLKQRPRDERGAAFLEATNALKAELANNLPDLVILFAPDHFNAVRWNMVPPFCIGLDAWTMDDWDIIKRRLNVPAEMSERLAAHIRKSDLDIAVSKRMNVDHGFSIPIALLFERPDSVPVVPIFINCAAPPLPSFKRTRLLGEAVGRFLAENRLNALIVGSGGLSHDPPHPTLTDLPEAARNAMLGVGPWDKDQEHARQQRVISAAVAMAEGDNRCLPPDAKWDKEILDIFTNQSLTIADNFSDEWVTSMGGCGGHEIRAWLAAFAALQASIGRYHAEVAFHDIVPEWITGMAIVKGRAPDGGRIAA